jgi:hypothetical protein
MKRFSTFQIIALLVALCTWGGIFQAQAQPSVPAAQPATLMTANSFRANWNASTGSGTISYRLDVATTNTFTAGTFVTGYNNVTVNALFASVTGLSGGTTYYYRVRSNNFQGTSASSSTITALTIPPAPVASAATAITPISFSANWATATGAASYLLDVATTSGFTAGTFVTGYNALAVAGGSTTTAAVSGLTGGTTYYYRVRAVNASGTGANSGNITVVTVPLAPVATAATLVTASSFSANWNAATGAASYRLDVSSNSFASADIVNNLTVNGLTQSVSGLTGGTTYQYRIRAVNASGTSDNSNVITQVTAIAGPVATAATAVTATSFSANWNSVASATGYQLDVASDVSFNTLVINNLDVTNVLTYPVAGLTSGVTYYYRVRAYNGVLWTTANSNTITQMTLLPPPDAPTALPATAISPTGFTVHWTPVATATQYRVDVAKLASFGPLVQSTIWDQVVVGQATSSYVVSGLGADTTYYYRVRAENAGGVSLNSSNVTVTRVITGAPLPPGTINVPYYFPLQAASDNGVTDWAIAGGALPAGLSVDPNTGDVTGTPTALGTASFTVQCTNDAPSNITRAYTLTIVATPTITLDARSSEGTYNYFEGFNLPSQTLSWTHTVAPPPAANRMLIVQVSTTSQSTRPLSSAMISSVTYNGVAMTRAARKSHSDLSQTDADFMNIEQWYLLDASLPNDGASHDVVVTCADSITGVGGGSVSLFNVMQSAPQVTASDSTVGTHLGTRITTLNSNTWLLNAAVNGYSGTFYPVPSQDPGYQLDNGTIDLIVDSKVRATPGLDSMQANHHIVYRMAQVVLGLAPAGSSAAVTANVKAYLDGPYVTPGDSMTNGLKTGGYLASHFTGQQIPRYAVDSVTVEIRNAATVAGSTVRLFAAAWLMTDGSIRDFYDTTKAYVSFAGASPGSFYLVVRHRNHLPVMSAATISLNTALSPAAYDFSTGQAKAYGTNPMIAAGTRFALYPGDVNGDGIVSYNNANNDRALIYALIGGASINATVTGYYNEDVGLNGTVSYNNAGNDRAIIYATIGGASINLTVTSQVPN